MAGSIPLRFGEQDGPIVVIQDLFGNGESVGHISFDIIGETVWDQFLVYKVGVFLGAGVIGYIVRHPAFVLEDHKTHGIGENISAHIQPGVIVNAKQITQGRQQIQVAGEGADGLRFHAGFVDDATGAVDVIDPCVIYATIRTKVWALSSQRSLPCTIGLAASLA